MNKFLFIVFVLNIPMHVAATTLVYGMRVHRLFIQTALLEKILPNQVEKKCQSIFSAVPIGQRRKRHFPDIIKNLEQFDKRLIGGSLFNLRCIIKKKWWLELTTGLLSESACESGANNFKATRTGFDDLLVAAGRNWYPDDKAQIVVQALVGFPTKRSVTLSDTFGPLVGTRLFSLGCGAEYSYAIKSTIEKSIIGIAQFRYLHFFNRNWFPILPCKATLIPGETVDFLFALRYRKNLHAFELGYNPTIFINQAVLLNQVKTKVGTFVSNGVYINYSQFCKRVRFGKKPTIFGCGISASKSKQFNSKTVAAWISVSIVL